MQETEDAIVLAETRFVIRLNNATKQDTKECMQRVKEALAEADKRQIFRFQQRWDMHGVMIQTRIQKNCCKVQILRCMKISR